MHKSQANYIPVTYFENHQKQKKQTKYVNGFRCKKHGRIDVRYDKLINIGGIKFCPFCVKTLFEDNGICQLSKVKEAIDEKRQKQKSRPRRYK